MCAKSVAKSVSKRDSLSGVRSAMTDCLRTMPALERILGMDLVFFVEQV
jgi:hypothetical protein